VDYENRRSRLAELMSGHGIDLAFAPPSGDLEYLTGFPRRLVGFGNTEYANNWLAGAFLRTGADPVYLVPQGYAAFGPAGGFSGDVIAVADTDDAEQVLARTVESFGIVRRVGVAARTWASTTTRIAAALGGAQIVDIDPLINQLRRIKSAAELEAMTRASQICDTVMAEITPRVAVGVTELEIAAEVDYLMRKHGGRAPSFDTGVFAMGPGDGRDATTRLSAGALRDGLGVSFDFGTVVEGYCSDFGRTIHVGEPGEEYRRVYDIVMAAQAAGIAAATPGTVCADVHAAVRAVVVDAGYGDWFRHRTGHCIGLDTHERPFISAEERTVLAEGMTFTLEPSIFWPGRVGARVEDIFVCTPGGARSLNRYGRELVAT
jgi:Xaa-Pro aminopeptidase